MTPISKEAWEALSGKAKWDVMSAMRGPDLGNSQAETIKWLSTAVLRSRMSAAIRVGGMVNDDLCGVIMPPALSPSPYIPWWSAHFFAHVKDAANWLDVPVWKLNPDRYYAILHDACGDETPHRQLIKQLLKADPPEAFRDCLEGLL